MGILNTTPDSFADGGLHLDPARAADAALAMADAGAVMLDVGGESTRPGASRVDAAEQIRRAVPVIARIRSQGGACGNLPISIDTTLASVAQAALDAGADAINDVSGGHESDGAMLRLAAHHGCGFILMHRVEPPTRDRYSDQYHTAPIAGDAVETVAAWLAERMRTVREAGVRSESIVLDPGLGFGKTVEQNLDLIRRTGELVDLGRPVLSALSRKSFVGRISLGRDSDPSERLPGTLTLSVAHLHAGARLFRVHDVAPHVQALGDAWRAMNPDEPGPHPKT